MRKAKVFLILFIVVCLGFISFGCQMQSWKEKDLYFMRNYQSEYDDYLRVAQMPNISDAQKKLLRKKKEILIDYYNAMIAFDMAVSIGETPSPELEAQLMNLLNQLQAGGL